MLGLSNTLSAEVNNALIISCNGGGPFLDFLCQKILKSTQIAIEKH